MGVVLRQETSSCDPASTSMILGGRVKPLEVNLSFPGISSKISKVFGWENNNKWPIVGFPLLGSCIVSPIQVVIGVIQRLHEKSVPEVLEALHRPAHRIGADQVERNHNK